MVERQRFMGMDFGFPEGDRPGYVIVSVVDTRAEAEATVKLLEDALEMPRDTEDEQEELLQAQTARIKALEDKLSQAAISLEMAQEIVDILPAVTERMKAQASRITDLETLVGTQAEQERFLRDALQSEADGAIRAARQMADRDDQLAMYAQDVAFLRRNLADALEREANRGA